MLPQAGGEKYRNLNFLETLRIKVIFITTDVVCASTNFHKNYSEFTRGIPVPGVSELVILS